MKRMSAFHRILVASAAVGGLALAVPATSSACTQKEYMTAEEMESGRYDNTTPEWYDDGSAPHTHDAGGETAPAAETTGGGTDTRTPDEPAAADPPRSEPNVGAPARDRAGSPRSNADPVARGQGGGPAAATPAPLSAAPPASSVPPGAQSPAAVPGHGEMAVHPSSAPAPQVDAARQTAQRRRAAERRAQAAAKRRAAAAAERHALKRARAVERLLSQARSTRPASPVPEATPAVPVATTDGAWPRPLGLGVLAVLLVVLVATAVARRLGGPGGSRRPVHPAEPTPGPADGDEVEAALQEIIAEHRAAEAAREGALPGG